MIKILIVENELPIYNLIKVSLLAAGYACEVANDGECAIALIEKNHYDLIVLDVMLPGLSGYDFMTYIKPMDIPVILLAEKSDVKDKVKGLSLGAEDYMTKPFEMIELLARIKVVLRRYSERDYKLTLEDIVVDTKARQVRKNGKIVKVTMKEYELLLLFIRNKNVALFRDVIFQRIWEGACLGDSRTVDLHVQRLRKKLGLEGKIKAVYKVGYRLEV